MNKLNLTPIASAVAGASSAETVSRDKWLVASKATCKAGVTVAMLTKGTEKAPNVEYDADVYATIREFIIIGISASKKAQKFESARAGESGAEALKGSHMWTVAQIVALTREELRDIDDDQLKMARRSYMQLIDGTMMGRLRGYMDRIENPEKARKARAEKNGKAAPEASGHLLDRMTTLLSEFNASVLALKNAAGVTLTGVIEAQNAGLELAARIGQIKR
jgi:hypothetical protein